jgi:hypothetical protein
MKNAEEWKVLFFLGGGEMGRHPLDLTPIYFEKSQIKQC